MEREEQLSAREVEVMAGQYGRGKGWNAADRGWSSGEVGRDRYPLLTAMAKYLRIVGWLMVAGAGILFYVQVVPWIGCLGAPRSQQRGMMGGASCGVAVLILAPTIVSLLGGFFTIAFGEVIGVFRAIEGNTHQLISSVEQAWNQIKLTNRGGQH